MLFLISKSYIKVTKPLKDHLNVPPELGWSTPCSVANNGQWFLFLTVRVCLALRSGMWPWVDLCSPRNIPRIMKMGGKAVPSCLQLFHYQQRTKTSQRMSGWSGPWCGRAEMWWLFWALWGIMTSFSLGEQVIATRVCLHNSPANWFKNLNRIS